MSKSAKKYQEELGKYQPKLKLEPLHCHGCSYPVPLKEQSLVQCPSCGAENQIPLPYQQLCEEQKKLAENNAISEEIIHRISAPPPLWIQFWGNVSSSIISFLGGIWLLISFITGVSSLVLLAMIYLLIRALAPVLGEDYADTIGADWIYAAVCCLLSLGFILPQVLLSFWEDSLNIRKTLQGSLSAKLIENTKGQAACRGCQATLFADGKQSVITCPYCETENLLSVPAEWLSKVKDFTNWHFKTVQEAIRTEEKLMTENRSSIHWWLGFTIAAAVISAGIGFIFQWSDVEGIPSWRTLQKQYPAFVPETISKTTTPLPNQQWLPAKELAPVYWISLSEMLLILKIPKFTAN